MLSKKQKHDKKFWPQKFLRAGGARVGILVGCDRDPKLWSANTRRTFWAFPWINDNFWKFSSKLAKDRVGQFGRLQNPDMFWPLHILVPRCKLLIIAYLLLNFNSSKCFYFENHWFKVCEAKSKKNNEKFWPPKIFRGGGPGSAFRLNMTATVNFGLHTHLKLSGPFDELITIFKKNCQNLSKNWVTFAGRFLENWLNF